MSGTTTAGPTFHFSYLIARSEDDAQEAIDRADDTIMTPELEIWVRFSYPLERSINRLLRADHPDGFTKERFARAVAVEYVKIYAEEAESMTGVAPSGIALNRGRSDGVHGIWGHGIGDLVLEAARRGPTGLWEIGVGS